MINTTFNDIYPNPILHKKLLLILLFNICNKDTEPEHNTDFVSFPTNGH